MPSQTPHTVTAEVESLLGPAPANRTQPEAVVLHFRRHGARLTLPVLVLFAVAVLSGFWIGGLPSAWMNVLALVCALVVAVLLGVFPILSWMAHRTTVTSHRIIMRQGLFSRVRHEVALNRVREVRLRRGLFQRMRGSGNIEVLHGNDTFVLDDAPGAGVIADALHDLMERNFENATRMHQRLGATAGAPAVQPSAADTGSPVTFW